MKHTSLLFILISLLSATFSLAKVNADMDSLIRQAEMMENLEQYNKAIVLYERHLQKDPMYIPILQRIAECSEKLNPRHAKDIKLKYSWLFINWADLNASTPKAKAQDSLFTIAQKLAAEENYDKATLIYHFLGGQEIAPARYKTAYINFMYSMEQKTQVHLELGETFFSNGSYIRALEEFHKAQFYHPDDSYIQGRINAVQSAVLELSLAYHKEIDELISKQELNDAYLLAEEALSQFPHDPEFIRLCNDLAQMQEKRIETTTAKAKSFFDSAQYKAAYEALKPLYEEVPNDPQVSRLMENIHKKLDEAQRISAIERIKAQFDQSLTREDVNAAQRQLDALRQLSPADYTRIKPKMDDLISKQRGRSFAADIQQARDAISKANYKVALAALNSAKAINPDAPEISVLESKITALIRQERINEANKIKNAAQKEEQQAELKKEEEQKAAAETQKKESAAQKDNESTANELLILGINYYRNGNFKEALATWENVLKLDSSNQQAKRYIYNVQQKLKRMNQ